MKMLNERDKSICRALLLGKSATDIARDVGLSRARISQIINKGWRLSIQLAFTLPVSGEKPGERDHLARHMRFWMPEGAEEVKCVERIVAAHCSMFANAGQRAKGSREAADEDAYEDAYEAKQAAQTKLEELQRDRGFSGRDLARARMEWMLGLDL